MEDDLGTKADCSSMNEEAKEMSMRDEFMSDGFNASSAGGLTTVIIFIAKRRSEQSSLITIKDCSELLAFSNAASTPAINGSVVGFIHPPRRLLLFKPHQSLQRDHQQPTSLERRTWEGVNFPCFSWAVSVKMGSRGLAETNEMDRNLAEQHPHQTTFFINKKLIQPPPYYIICR
nr:hypothetical protein Iba_chr12dCG12820 [Ipomoea batatas]